MAPVVEYMMPFWMTKMRHAFVRLLPGFGAILNRASRSRPGLRLFPSSAGGSGSPHGPILQDLRLFSSI
jgi:hypothetical protein